MYMYTSGLGKENGLCSPRKWEGTCDGMTSRETLIPVRRFPDNN